ncbi:MAG: PilZ domain-containing protein [Candidatus Omnitrophica bacterium]|nr:PilZ domain-containing protein [Candidatus Omnitrophota bacterium]
MSKPLKERRLYQRIEHAMPVKIIANGYDFLTSTQNISCVGAYCNIPKYIPPFTKVMIKLSLPLRTREKTDNCDIECKGVVVRTEDHQQNGFNIAIFFNRINEEQRKKISQYLTQFLPQS